MKLLTFLVPSEIAKAHHQHIGVLTHANVIVDLQTSMEAMMEKPSQHFQSMLAFLEGGGEALKLAEQVCAYALSQNITPALYPLSTISLLAPLPRPLSLRDCVSFEKHMIQVTHPLARRKSRSLKALDQMIRYIRGCPLFCAPAIWYQNPLYYKGNPLNIIGPNATVCWPGYAQKLDYELEFAVVIGQKGRNIPVQKAKEYIAGYMIFNDFSARDVLGYEMGGRLGPAKGKDFDTGNVLGPYLVTPDEVSDPYNLTMVARVNGVEWSRGTSADMYFSFEEIIAYISQDETLHVGEVIGSGTVGNGCGFEHNRWLQPGDQVELEIEHLGILQNTIMFS